MGKPLDPLPLVVVGRGDHDDQHVVGSVEGHRLNDHRAHHRPAALRRRDRHRREGRQRHRGGQQGNDGPRPNQLAQHRRARRIDVLRRTGVRRDETGDQPLVTQTHPNVEEIRVTGTPLPHPGGSDEVGQRRRRGVGMVQGRPLRPGGPLDLPSDAIEVDRVITPRLGQLGRA